METAIIWVAIAFVALCLWLVARNDLVRLNGISRQVRGEVIGHHSSIHDNARSYAPIYRFSAEGETHEVTDQVYSGAPKPPVGTLVQLSYPHGRPDLARVPRFGVQRVEVEPLLSQLAKDSEHWRTRDWARRQLGRLP